MGLALCARGAKQPGASTPSATLVARQLGVGPAALRIQTARGGDPRTPRGLWAHLLLGALAPHVALRASLPLFCFRPPLPCPRAAAIPYGAEARLLRCCRCLLVNVDTLSCTVPSATGAWPPQALAPATCLACSVVPTDQLGCFRWLLPLGSSPVCRGPAGPRPVAPVGHLLRVPALPGTAPVLRASDRDALSQHVLLRTPGPYAISCQFHTCWRAASR